MTYRKNYIYVFFFAHGSLLEEIAMVNKLIVVDMESAILSEFAICFCSAWIMFIFKNYEQFAFGPIVMKDYNFMYNDLCL